MMTEQYCEADLKDVAKGVFNKNTGMAAEVTNKILSWHEMTPCTQYTTNKALTKDRK